MWCWMMLGGGWWDRCGVGVGVQCGDVDVGGVWYLPLRSGEYNLGIFKLLVPWVMWVCGTMFINEDVAP